MTTEGWIGVMWNAVDGTQIDVQPKKDNIFGWVFLFYFFMFVASLFVLNMFVGITITVFTTEKDKLHLNHYLTEMQEEWCDVMISIYGSKPLLKYQITDNFFFDGCYYIASSTLFDNFIFFCITANTVIMCLTWYD